LPWKEIAKLVLISRFLRTRVIAKLAMLGRMPVCGGSRKVLLDSGSKADHLRDKSCNFPGNLSRR